MGFLQYFTVDVLHHSICQHLSACVHAFKGKRRSRSPNAFGYMALFFMFITYQYVWMLMQHSFIWIGSGIGARTWDAWRAGINNTENTRAQHADIYCGVTSHVLMDKGLCAIRTNPNENNYETTAKNGIFSLIKNSMYHSSTHIAISATHKGQSVWNYDCSFLSSLFKRDVNFKFQWLVAPEFVHAKDHTLVGRNKSKPQAKLRRVEE